MDLTRVGFGAWAVGGGGWKFGWGQQDDRESVSTMLHAVESGINWIDTAPVYGLGRSEEIVGRALQEINEAERPYVFTKCGLTFDRERPEEGPWNVMGASSVRAELESSLRRLGVEQIDLYQVHWPPDDGTALEEYWETMLELKRSGLVRAIGLSNHDEQQLARAESLGHVDSLQPPFSMIHREAGAGLLQHCAAQRTGAIVYSPMQSGLLTGAMSEARIQSLPEDDWRRTHEDFTGTNGKRNLALADALLPIAERHGVVPGAVAIAWTLRWPEVTGAIVGARSPEQVDGWLPAASLVIEDNEIAELTAAIERTRAGSGPLGPGERDA
jgi:aryl-alcohol dehydrogenase-like predicted oxidoreductase